MVVGVQDFQDLFRVLGFARSEQDQIEVFLGLLQKLEEKGSRSDVSKLPRELDGRFVQFVLGAVNESLVQVQDEVSLGALVVLHVVHVYFEWKHFVYVLHLQLLQQLNFGEAFLDTVEELVALSVKLLPVGVPEQYSLEFLLVVGRKRDSFPGGVFILELVFGEGLLGETGEVFRRLELLVLIQDHFLVAGVILHFLLVEPEVEVFVVEGIFLLHTHRLLNRVLLRVELVLHLQIRERLPLDSVFILQGESGEVSLQVLLLVLLPELFLGLVRNFLVNVEVFLLSRVLLFSLGSLLSLFPPLVLLLIFPSPYFAVVLFLIVLEVFDLVLDSLFQSLHVLSVLQVLGLVVDAFELILGGFGEESRFGAMLLENGDWTVDFK